MKCFWRSCLVTAGVTLVVMLGREFLEGMPKHVRRETVDFAVFFISGTVGSALPDYKSRMLKGPVWDSAVSRL
jgi:hypothetical protein